jgi:hypothetical protein
LILAHGIGGRSDLPVPLWLAVSGGAAAIFISFFVLGAFWKSPRFEDPAQGRSLPHLFQRAADSRIFSLALSITGLAILAVTLLCAFVGPNSSAANPAPTWFYVWFWVGLVPISFLFGPIWRKVNPVRTISSIVYRFVNGTEPPLEVPPRWGYVPASIGLLTFLWLELVFDRAEEPSVVATFIVLYLMANVLMGSRFGPNWSKRGDAFEVYSELLARMSPLGRRKDGRLVLRNPLVGLAQIKLDGRLVQVLTILIGSTAFDGLTRTQIWLNLTLGRPRGVTLILGTLGLAACILFISVTYRTAVELSQRFTDQEELAGRFVHSLIPIAAGYTIAHYFSLFVFQGQAGYILASDPFGTGANFFGTTDWAINYRLVSTSLIAVVQVLSIVVGHILGVTSAHDRAIAVFPDRYKTRSQFSLLLVMVVYTCVGIALLVGT